MSDQPKKETRKLAAIMFTDIVGYTALMSKNEERTLALLQKKRDVLKPLVKQYNGTWLKEMGDGTISSFQSTFDAVNCAVDIQQALKNDPEIKIRIGIHIGDVVFSEGDIFGDGVNVASRIEPLAEPGGICISYRVYEDIANKPDLEAVPIGEKTLKNVSRPVKVFAIIGKGLPCPKTIMDSEKKDKEKKGVLSRELIFGIISAALLVFVLSYGWIIPTYFAGEIDTGKIDSIAILPFECETENNDINYLSKGIPQSIISILQEKTEMRIHSFSAILQQYKDGIPSPSVIGNELKVKAVANGRMTLRGENLTLNVEITDTRDNSVIVSAQYFEKLENPEDLQGNIAKKIIKKLNFELAKKKLLANF
jgi:class 3 adenylate cyclase/TolB-like protein